jgi:hypothetical protein
VSKTVDIHIDRIGRLERGTTEPSFAEAARLGEFFGVQPDTLFPLRTRLGGAA